MREDIKSAVTGFIVGDCLGLPYEFKTSDEMLNNQCTGMTGYGAWNKPVGTWSDDTSMTLATMNSLIKNNVNVDYDNIMREFSRWCFNGEYTCDGECFGIGNTVSYSLLNFARGVEPLECGLSGVQNNGNGSLMRMLPFVFTDTDYETIMNVSSLTHAHDRAKIACVLYVEIGRQILSRSHDTFCESVSVASELVQDYFDGNDELSYFNRVFESDYGLGVKSTGYVVDTLECAVASIKLNDDFESALLWCVNLGGDTDTLGAVCGGLAGLYYGFDDIPSEWLESVRGLDYVDGLIDGFSRVVE